MKKRFHVKKGDAVVVIAGAARGRRGIVRQMLTKKDSVILESADAGDKAKEGEPVEKSQLIKPLLHYMRKSQTHPNGAMIWMEGPIHVSNVMKAEEAEARAARRAAKTALAPANPA